MRILLKESAPISPVSVPVLSMLSTPAFESISLPLPLCGCPERTDWEPVIAETLLALLFRPLMLEGGSVKGIVPPLEACNQVNEVAQEGYPKVVLSK